MKRLIALISAIIIGSIDFILLICHAEKTWVLILPTVLGFILLYVVYVICKHFKIGYDNENNNA